MDSYQKYLRKLDIFFSGKQQGAIRTELKSYSLPIFHGGDDFQFNYIFFNIFNNSIFSNEK